MESIVKVVFAEDSKVQALILQRALKEAGFESQWGKDGMEAFELVKEFKPNILISDVEMPEMDGYTLCKKIKDTPETKDTPVLLLTSLRDTADILRGLSAGADAYVTKPYDTSHLITRIQHLLKHLHIQDDINKPLLVQFKGEKFNLDVERTQLLNLLLSTYENTVRQNKRLTDIQIQLKRAHEMVKSSLERSKGLLYRVLPEKVAEELSEKGFSVPKNFESVTVLFTDFVGFTRVSSELSPGELILELEEYFDYFDYLAKRHNIEKLKTIGDAYMCVAGVPISNRTHPLDMALFAIDIREHVQKVAKIKKSKKNPFFDVRIGVHTGNIIAGVIGEKRFTYDIWGDTVNIASRMESGGLPNKINISEATRALISNYFEFTPRGKIEVKNRGMMDMFFLDRLLPEYAEDAEGFVPNQKFKEAYEKYG